jgi:hypothetical protein
MGGPRSGDGHLSTANLKADCLPHTLQYPVKTARCQRIQFVTDPKMKPAAIVTGVDELRKLLRFYVGWIPTGLQTPIIVIQSI